jgi:pyruvate kinase
VTGEWLNKLRIDERVGFADARGASRSMKVGPHIVEAIETLNDILRRMQHHQVKKISRLRPLHLGAVQSPR